VPRSPCFKHRSSVALLKHWWVLQKYVTQGPGLAQPQATPPKHDTSIQPHIYLLATRLSVF